MPTIVIGKSGCDNRAESVLTGDVDGGLSAGRTRETGRRMRT
ncbi:hypothetical protein SAMN05421854_110191 [Amycolatopsis rubida]|uniref:Uncharacterized protein n=1 Tax=Amycolatopsis rubida TaxID=112413 RepID=A0A1I5XF44_9PSEU|nr:hypothetical protein SAMN05421854_110191 [Amycolatopsis rubida]